MVAAQPRYAFVFRAFVIEFVNDHLPESSPHESLEICAANEEIER